MQTTTPIPLETKASSGGIEGYGSVFGNVDFGGDVVLPDAFNKSIQEYKDSNKMPQMFWMHKADQVPGKWDAMKSDNYGLFMKGQFVDTTLGKDMRILTSTKSVSGLSIGYLPNIIGYDKEGNRLLKEVDLMEVSVVSLAMNPKAEITSLKSRLSQKGEYVPDEDELAEIKRDCEVFLRHKGWSRRAAKAGVSNLFKEFTSGMLDDSSDDSVMLDDANMELGLKEIESDSVTILRHLDNYLKDGDNALIRAQMQLRNL